VQRILLDLTDVTFMDSLSMAAVVATQRRLGEDGPWPSSRPIRTCC
jgi:anti-anti-sigma regulatory factor